MMKLNLDGVPLNYAFHARQKAAEGKRAAARRLREERAEREEIVRRHETGVTA